MFAVCHTQDNKDDVFIMYDRTDMKDISKQVGITVEKNIDFPKMLKNYSFFPIMSCNDLILRILNRKTRTDTHILDELSIHSFMAIKKEYELIQAKLSKLSHSQREIVERVYHNILSMDQPETVVEETAKTD